MAHDIRSSRLEAASRNVICYGGTAGRKDFETSLKYAVPKNTTGQYHEYILDKDGIRISSMFVTTFQVINQFSPDVEMTFVCWVAG